MLKVDTPLSEIHGIGLPFLKRLKKLNIETARDLLWHFPSRYEDFSEIYSIADLEPGQYASIQGVIQDAGMRRTWQRRMTITEALIADQTGTIRAIWFNQPYLRNILRPGRTISIAGKVGLSDHELYFSHPTYEMISKTSARATTHTARLVPIYPETKGLTSKGLRYLIQPLLTHLTPPPEWIPEEILRLHGFPELSRALRDIHFPNALDDALHAKRRFAFEDLFLLQLVNLKEKSKRAKENASPIPTDIEWLKQIISLLPFALTQSQKKSLWEIIQDAGKSAPMNRLLQGDVGSGKTVVAALTALIAARAGYQSAFMAPTEVLARQHFETLKELFARFTALLEPPSVGFLAAGGAKLFYGEGLETEIKKEPLKQKIEKGEIAIVVGTHALISGKENGDAEIRLERAGLRFQNLGLVIVDEQHRFGVAQRAALLKNNARGSRAIPHFLSMSATPIPRTLMLTIFGDLDISTIAELPLGRKKIMTKIVAPDDRTRAYQFIRAQIKNGRQAFVICPRIAAPENGGEPHPDYSWAGTYKKLELKSVKEECERLSKKIFPDLKVAMLHGQMPASGGSAFGGKPSKEAVMQAFKDGKIDVLVTTSVVEVGVDVPNATVMMVEGSDRFGLAQLYQFRGRVGRGAHESYCFLLTDSNGKTARARLKAIIEAKNGFELAETDLKLRGPGEFLGKEQTGLPDLAMQGLQDAALIASSREAAAKLIQEDPTLREFFALREKLSRLRKQIHRE